MITPKNSPIVGTVLLDLAICVACLPFAGCENMSEADAGALALAGIGMDAKTPQQAQSAALLSEFAAEAGRRQHEMQVAKGGRAQITINNNTGQTSNSQGSVASMAQAGSSGDSSVPQSDAAQTPDINWVTRSKAIYEKVVLKKAWFGSFKPVTSNLHVLPDRLVLKDKTLLLVISFGDVIDIRADDSAESDTQVVVDLPYGQVVLDFGPKRDRRRVIADLWQDLKSAGYDRIERR